MSVIHEVPAFPRVDAQALAEATAFFQSRAPFIPRLALLLHANTALFAEHLRQPRVIPTAEMPHTIARQNWIFGECGGKKILLLANTATTFANEEATSKSLLIHVMARVGVQRLLVADCATNLNPNFAAGELLLLDDHINLTFRNPLRGAHRKEWGEGWPDMSAPYSPTLQSIALQVARAMHIPLRRGVLFCLRAPHHQTPAEIEMAKRAGADALAACSLTEILTAISRRMQVLALMRLRANSSSACEAMHAAEGAFTELVQRLIKRIG